MDLIQAIALICSIHTGQYFESAAKLAQKSQAQCQKHFAECVNVNKGMWVSQVLKCMKDRKIE